MKPVVWVTSEASPCPRSGGTLRTHQLLGEVASRTDVALVVIGERVDERALARATGARLVDWFPTRRAPANRATALRHRWPLPVARSWQPAAVAHVRALQKERVSVLEHLLTTPYRPLEGRYLAALHNVDSDLVRAAPVRGRTASFRSIELRRYRRLERTLARDSQALVVVASEIDTAAFPGSVVVTNGTVIPPIPPPLGRPGDWLFVGALDYPPNREGLAWFATSVWPHLRPGARPLLVVGRGGARALGRLAEHPALRVVGEVADVAPYLAAAGGVIVPLLRGSGSRLKVLEGLSFARPLVSTTVGACGLPVRCGVEAMIADTPESFASAMQALQVDLGLAGKLAGKGRALAEQFEWSPIREKFADLLEDF